MSLARLHASLSDADQPFTYLLCALGDSIEIAAPCFKIDAIFLLA